MVIWKMFVFRIQIFLLSFGKKQIEMICCPIWCKESDLTTKKEKRESNN